MIKRMFTLLSLAYIVGCGGGGESPGVGGFDTVYVSVGSEKPVVDVDIVNLRLEQGSCTAVIPMSAAERQTLTISAQPRPGLPSWIKPSDIMVDQLRISLFPARGVLDSCFNNYPQPNIITPVQAGGSKSISIAVITQEIKGCLLQRYLQSTAGCTTATFQFPPDESPEYVVYATLSFRVTEVQTGKSRSMEISFGTYKLNDYVGGGQ